MAGQGVSAVSDEDEVADSERTLARWRARNAAFLAATERIEMEPLSDVVVARFDADAALTALDIDPIALTDYTNTELEELITAVVQDTREQVREEMLALFARYLVPSSPEYEPDLPDVGYVETPAG